MARILVIEDDPISLELALYVLRAHGHDVLAACTGREGCDVAGREVPDLVLCDIHMPEMDGFELARHFKQSATLRYIPLVAVTALAMVGDRERILSAGFDGYITKPITPESISDDLEGFLAIRGVTPRGGSRRGD